MNEINEEIKVFFIRDEWDRNFWTKNVPTKKVAPVTTMSKNASYNKQKKVARKKVSRIGANFPHTEKNWWKNCLIFCLLNLLGFVRFKSMRILFYHCKKTSLL